MRALPHGAAADALATVRASQASVTTKRAFEFLVLTAVRSGEVRGARWTEIELTDRAWTIPATRMEAHEPQRRWSRKYARSFGFVEEPETNGSDAPGSRVSYPAFSTRNRRAWHSADLSSHFG